MPYLLDTNAAIALMKGHPAVLRQVERVGRTQLRLCAPVEGELWFGVAKSAKVAENRLRLLTLLDWLPSIAFSGEATRRFGELRASQPTAQQRGHWHRGSAASARPGEAQRARQPPHYSVAARRRSHGHRSGRQIRNCCGHPTNS